MKKAITTLTATMLLLMTVLSITPTQAVVVPSITWLPPLTNQDLFQLKDGSTLPIKFSLTYPGGTFVRDETVTVAVNKVIFRDNFDDETTGADPSPWISREPTGTDVSIDDTVYYGASGKSAKLVDNSLTARPDMYYEIPPQTGSFSYQISVRLAQNNDWDTFLYISEGDGMNEYPGGALSNCAVSIVFGGDGYIKYNDGTWKNVQTYSSNTWYTARVFVDIPNQRYDLYIDGDLKANNVAFRYTHYTLDRIFATTTVGTASIIWVDNVLVLKDPIKTFTYGEGDDNVRIYGSESALSLLSEDFDTTPTGSDPDGWTEYGLGAWTVEKDPTAPSQGASGYGDVYSASASSTTWTRDFSFMTVASDFSDGVFEFQFKLLTDATTTPRITIPVRYQDDNNWILFDVDTGVFRTGYYIFVATTGGGWVQLAGKSSVITKDVWHTMKIVLEGWNYDMWIDGVQELTASDTVQAFSSGKIGLGVYRNTHAHFDDVSLMVGYYIANLHTKELALPVGTYAITVWFEGSYPIEDTYLFELADNVQGKGRGKGKA